MTDTTDNDELRQLVREWRDRFDVPDSTFAKKGGPKTKMAEKLSNELEGVIDE